MRNAHGSFIWYELLTTDPGAAAVFYGSVVGWTCSDSGQSGMDYRIWSAGDTSVGGLMALPPGAAESGMRPGWLGYIGVDDVDRAVTGITAVGGSILMPATDIENVGRIAMVADPQGVVFYVMRGAVDAISTAFEPKGEGHCGWNELATSDQAGALDFYTRLFGWTKGDVMPMGDMGDYQFLHHDGEVIGAVMTAMPGGPPPRWTCYFRVPDIASAEAAVTTAGGTVTHGPMDVPGGDRILLGTDPQGAAFALVAAA